MRLDDKLTLEEAYELASGKLIEMYEYDGGQKFIHHLIYSFYGHDPIYMVGRRHSGVVDCITARPLTAVNIGDLNDSRVDEMIRKDEIEDGLSPEETVELNGLIDRYAGDLPSTVAFRSPVSDKFIGRCELRALLDFIRYQTDRGNEKIARMVKYVKVGQTLAKKKSEFMSAMRAGGRPAGQGASGHAE